MDPAAKTYDIGDNVTLTNTFIVLATKGTISVGQNDLTVSDPTGYVPTDPVLVEGAGANGGDLYTTIGSIAGSVLTLATPALTSVNRALVGKLATPASVTCKVKKPDGTISTLTVANPSVGRYTAPFPATLEGDHFAGWTGTGTATGYQERQFVVREKRVI